MNETDKTVAEKVAARYVNASRIKTAGEVRFVKDKSGDKSEWGWGTPGPSEREQDEDYKYDPKNVKQLAEVLRAGLLAMGHALSAHALMTRIKSAQVSPDGALGGKGFIQKIPDMRRQLMNVCEALSSVTDTLYDEVKAPHWNPKTDENGNRERDEVKNLLEDVEELHDDPKGVAEKEEDKMDDDAPAGPSGKYANRKQASTGTMVDRVAHRYCDRLGMR